MTTTPTLWKDLTQVNTSDGGTAQTNAQIVGVADGGYVVVWVDSSGVHNPGGSAIVAQKYDAVGEKVGGEVMISPFFFGDHTQPAVAVAPDGHIAVAFTHSSSGDSNIYVCHYDANLAFLRQDTIDTEVGKQTFDPAITFLGDGRYQVSFTTGTGIDTTIVGRTVSPTGAVGAQFDIFNNSNSDSQHSALATLSNGDLIVVYQTDAPSNDVFFRPSGPDGPGTSGTFFISGGSGPADETDPDIAALSGGGFVIVWTDGGDIRAAIYSNSRELVVGNILVNTTTEGAQDGTSVIALADGGFLVTWEDNDLNFMWAQRFDAAGNKVGAQFAVKAGTSAADSPEAALLADGRIAFVVGDTFSGDRDIMTSIWDPRDDSYFGTPGDDLITARVDGATVVGLGGDDRLLGQGATDTLIGGTGDDRLSGGAGNDDLHGQDGIDTADYSSATSGVTVDLGTGTASGGADVGSDTLTGIENAIGGSNNDTIAGTGGANVLDGGAGVDTMIGGEGNDRYVVDNAGDVVTENANEGTDSVETALAFYQLGDNVENLTLTGTGQVGFGNSLDNVLTGGSGSDSLTGNFGNDTYVAGDGSDYLYIDHLDTSIDAGDGYDAIFIQDSTGTSLNVAAAHAEWVYAWVGEDTLDASGSAVGVALVGEAGADQLIGSAFDDYLYIDAFDTLIDAGDGIDALFVFQGNGQGAVDTFIDVSAANAEWVLGGAGNDTITNAGDADSVALSGGGGNDRLTGGLGNDYLYGNEGTDTFVVTSNAQLDTILDFEVDVDKVDLSAIDGIDDFLALWATAMETEDGTTFDLGGGNQLMLYQIAFDTLSANDFIFAP